MSDRYDNFIRWLLVRLAAMDLWITSSAATMGELRGVKGLGRKLMAVSQTTVKVDRRYLKNKTKDDLIVLVLQLMETGEKKDAEIQRLKDKLLVMKAFDAKKTIEIRQLTQWVYDCQSGMYINCVYCGHRYGPEDKVPVTMQQALYDHIAVCPKHPLSKAKAEIEQLKEELAFWRQPKVV